MHYYGGGNYPDLDDPRGFRKQRKSPLRRHGAKLAVVLTLLCAAGWVYTHVHRRRLISELESHRDQLFAVETDRARLQTLVAEHSGAASHRERETRHLHRTIEHLQGEISTQASATAEAEQKSIALERERDDAKAQAAAHATSGGACAARTADLLDQVQACSREREQARASLAEVRVALETAKSEQALAQNTEKGLRDRIVALEAQIRSGGGGAGVQAGGVPQQVPVPVQQQVPVPAQQQQQVPVPVPAQQQVPVPVPAQQQVPVPVPAQQQQVPVPVPAQQQQVPVPVPAQQQQQVPVPAQQQQVPVPVQQQQQVPVPAQQQQQVPVPVQQQQQQVPVPVQQQQQVPVPAQQQQNQAGAAMTPNQQAIHNARMAHQAHQERQAAAQQGPQAVRRPGTPPHRLSALEQALGHDDLRGAGP